MLSFLACAQPKNTLSQLEVVQERGELLCGVSGILPGFSVRDHRGIMTGFDVDFCRAVAAAVLGDAMKVRFVPLNAAQRFSALADGKIDVLVRNTTWTISRDTALGLTFAGINYYDGQGFMVMRSLGVKSATELKDVSLCTQKGSTSELNMADYFRAAGIEYTPLIYDSFAATREAFAQGECAVLTTDVSQLVAVRSQLIEPRKAVILPEIIAKEPLGPVVREDDVQWFRIVKWTLFALINAEELGITQDTVDEHKKDSQDQAVRRFLQGESGKSLGLDNEWAYRAVKQVGNYGEIFARNFGPHSAVHLPRGLNALWKDGGILYAPPIR